MRKALVVDDSRLARVTLTRMLEKRGFQVEGVESGEEALEYLRRERPEVVFMDFMMPQMSGYEATRAIRDNPETGDIPVVMCTSQDTPEDRAEAERNGARGFITKPATEQQLAQVLEQLAGPAAPAAPAPSPEDLLAQLRPAIDAAVEARLAGLREELSAALESQLAEHLSQERESGSAALQAAAEQWSGQLEARLADLPAGGADPAQLEALLDSRLEARFAAERKATMDAVLADSRLTSMVEWNIAAIPKPASVDDLLNEPRLVGVIHHHLEARLERERTVTLELLLNSQRLVDLIASLQPQIPETVTTEQVVNDPALQRALSDQVKEQMGRHRAALLADLPADARFREIVQELTPKPEAGATSGRAESPSADVGRVTRLAQAALGVGVIALAVAVAAAFIL